MTKFIVTFIITVAISTFVGYKIENHTGTGLLAGLVVGTILGLVVKGVGGSGDKSDEIHIVE